MGLRKEENDPKFMAHEGYYQQAPRNAEVHILENVTEYDIKMYVRRYFGEGWDCFAAKVDPRLWGFGYARPRHYGIAWKRSSFSWDPEFPVDDILESLKAQPIMKAADFYWMKLAASNLTFSEDLQLNLCCGCYAISISQLHLDVNESMVIY